MVWLEGFEARPYQETVAASLYETEDNALVELDMGLGKTETALMVMAAEVNRAAEQGEEYSALIVLPNSQLIDQWETRLDEYGLSEELTVMKNPRVSDLTHDGHDSPIYGSGAARDSAAGLRDRRDRITQWENNRKVQWAKQRSLTDADITLTTFQQLYADTGRGGSTKRFDYDVLEGVYDDVILDEATHFVRYGIEDDVDRFDTDFEVSAYFEDMYGALNESTRFIGLTGFPGDKRHALVGALDATRMRPSPDETAPYLPAVETVTHETGDQVIERVYDHFQGRADQLSMYIEGKLPASKHVTPQTLGQLINSDDEKLQKWARQYWSYESMAKRLEESIGPTLTQDVEDIIDRMDPEDASPELASIVQHLPEYRPMKEDGLVNLTDQLLAYEQRPVVFTTFRNTARGVKTVLENQLDASVGTVTGEIPDDTRTDELNAFNAGARDVLVMTYGVGSEGLDLTEGNHAIHLRTPNTGKRYSATGRIRRGEDETVTEHLLMYAFSNEKHRKGKDTLWERRAVAGTGLDPSEDALEAIKAVGGRDDETA